MKKFLGPSNQQKKYWKGKKSVECAQKKSILVLHVLEYNDNLCADFSNFIYMNEFILYFIVFAAFIFIININQDKHG